VFTGGVTTPNNHPPFLNLWVISLCNMHNEVTTNSKLEAWTAAMAAGEKMGSLGDLVSKGSIKVYKDQYLRLKDGYADAWIYVSESTKSRGVNPADLEVTLRKKINGEPGMVAQACAPAGRDASLEDLSKLFG
jgi:hypothetical protein